MRGWLTAALKPINWFLDTFWYWLPVLGPLLFLLAAIIIWIIGHPAQAVVWIMMNAVNSTYTDMF